jgi:hypothetical protein
LDWTVGGSLWLRLYQPSFFQVILRAWSNFGSPHGITFCERQPVYSRTSNQPL